MGFRAALTIELEATSLSELLGQIAAVGGGQAKISYTGPQTSEVNVPETSTPAPKPGRPKKTEAPATSPAAGGEASSPAPDAPPAPAPAPASEKPPASEKLDQAKLQSDLRAVLTPFAQKGAKERGEVNLFVQGKGFKLLTDIPAEALPAIIVEAKGKFA